MTTAQKKRRRVTFRVQAEPGSEVFVSGTFNDWVPTQKKLQDKHGTGEFMRTLVLPEGRHEYKFVLNGEWAIDAQNSEWAPNEEGSLNSVLVVG